MFEGRAEQSLATQATGILNSAFWRIEKSSEAAHDDRRRVVPEATIRDITRRPTGQAHNDGHVFPLLAPRGTRLFEHILVQTHPRRSR
jgi:hypothetical protein